METNNQDRKKAWTQQQRRLAQNPLLLPDEMLEAMLAAIDEHVEHSGCDHTLKFTQSWITEHQQPEEKILTWLREHGGFCDCEVLANAAAHWEQNK